MWTEIARRQYERHDGPHASDLTEREWVLIEPFMPRRKKIGHLRTMNLCDVMDAILYIGLLMADWLLRTPWTSGHRRACMAGRRATVEVALDPAAPTGIAGGAHGVRAP